MNLLQKAWVFVTGRAHDVYPINFPGPAHMFGSMAAGRVPISTQKDFIPVDNVGGTLPLNPDADVSPIWLGLNTIFMQTWAYDYCSPLAAVIDRLAEADTNGRIEFLNPDGSTIPNVNKVPNLYRIKKLFSRPNPLQTWHEFNNEQVVLCKQYGCCPVFAIGPRGMDKSYTKFMINLSREFADPVKNENFDLLSDNEDNLNPISGWKLRLFGEEYVIPSSDVILVKDGLSPKPNGSNLGLPRAKMEGLDYWISNICAAMEADNVLLKKKGPLGIFSHDPKPDIAGWTPMEATEKDEIQNELTRYGLSWGQLQYVISKVPIKWNPMSFNVRDLMTKETVRQGIDGICDRFGYPAELMSGKNATYENRNSAEKFLYQNNIIPFSLRRMAVYNNFFGIENMVLDYDHLPVLQEDIMKSGQAREAMSASLVMDWQAGMISYNEYRDLQGLDKKPGMDDYFYKDYLKDNPIVVKKQKSTLKPVKSGNAA
jgi:hypothetical protein